MVVDDEEPILFAMHDYFTAHGWQVDCAQAIEEAKSLADANEYDVVITDLHLTGVHEAEGLDLVRFVRSRGSAKVIVFTAYATNELEQSALQLGAHAFLQKTTPIAEIAKLLAALSA